MQKETLQQLKKLADKLVDRIETLNAAGVFANGNLSLLKPVYSSLILPAEELRGILNEQLVPTLSQVLSDKMLSSETARSSNNGTSPEKPAPKSEPRASKSSSRQRPKGDSARSRRP